VRIFPALFAMLAVVVAYGTRLLPIEFGQLSASAAAAIAFASNLYFWRTSDYFSPAAELMPLLHTWSLGVEEQFYIFYPMILVVLARWRSRLRWTIPALAIASFALGWIAGLSSPVATFYLLPFRAWELLIGAAVAVGAFPKVGRPRHRSLLAIVGALLVVAGILLVRSGAGFPVPLAAAPALGAALIIAYAEATPVGKALSLTPVRWIGRISYSLYLWHWPIIAFYRTETGIALDGFETAGLVVASVVAGALSFLLVEQPAMRRFRSAPASPKVVAVGLTGVVLGSGAILALAATAPVWRSIDPAIARIAGYADYLARPEYQYQFRRGPCFRGEAQADLPFDPEACVKPDPARPDMVVVGDSYAAQYWRAFALRYRQRNVMQATASGCRPVVGEPGEARCREVVDHVLGPLLNSGALTTVVLAGRWLDEDLAYLPATIRRIRAAGAVPAVIGPVPEYQGEFPAILARALLRRDLGHIEAWRVRVRDREALDRRMEALVRDAGGVYLSPMQILCGSGTCLRQTADGAPVQFDYGHLTLAGSRWVVARMPAL